MAKRGRGRALAQTYGEFEFEYVVIEIDGDGRGRTGTDGIGSCSDDNRRSYDFESSTDSGYAGSAEGNSQVTSSYGAPVV